MTTTKERAAVSIVKQSETVSSLSTMRTAMQQALEACKRNQSAQAQAILEEALAGDNMTPTEQVDEEGKITDYMLGFSDGKHYAHKYEQAEHEPVALSKTERDAKRYAYMNHPDFFEVCDLDSHLYRYRVGIQPTVKKGFPKPINQCIEGYGETLEAAIDMAIAAKQPVSEPVARVIVRPFNPMDASCPTTEVKWLKEPVPGFLYAAPVRTKDLTDDEIDALIDKSWIELMTIKEFARAVIAADREKNK